MLDPAYTPTPLVVPGDRPPVATVTSRPPRRFRGAAILFRLVRWALPAAWQRLRGRWDAAANARAVRTLFEDLGGIWIKVGQLLSLRVDVFSVELCRELTRLQDAVPGFPSEVARRIIETELGAPIDQVFARFEDHPIAAASIGQVHRGQLAREGTWVAVKVRRPYVQEAFAAELAITRRWVRRLDRFGVLRFVQWRQMQWELERILREETDYRVEGASIARMRRSLRPHRMYVPEPYPRYTTSKVLVMELIVGVQMSDYILARLNDPERVRAWERDNDIDPAAVVRRFSHSILRQILEDNLFHGDLHPGNIVLLRGGCVALLDFGSVGITDRAYLDKFGVFMEAITRDEFERAADMALLMSGPVPPGADVGRARAEVVRELRGWRARTGVAALPYPLKSVDAVNVAITKVLFRQRITFDWAFLRIRRALATMDASAMHLYPAANYPKITTAYFRRARRRQIARHTARGDRAWAGGPVPFGQPGDLVEASERMADVQRRQVRAFSRTAGHASAFVRHASRVLSVTLGAASLLAGAALVDGRLAPGWLAAARPIDGQVWLLAIVVTATGAIAAVRVTRAFSGRVGSRHAPSAAFRGLDGRRSVHRR